MHTSCVVMLNCYLDNIVQFSLVISLQLFFSQFHGPLYEYLGFVTVCYYVHYFEIVVSNESDSCIVCQVEVLYSIFAPMGNLQSLTAPSALEIILSRCY